MLSDIISVNSNASINPEQREERSQLYQVISSQGLQFRVLTREYTNKSSIISLWCVFWISSTLAATSLLLGKLELVTKNLVFFSLLLSAIVFIAVALYLRKTMEKSIMYSTLNFAALLAAVSVLALFGQGRMTIVLATLTFFQLLVTACYMKSKGKIGIQVILLGQICFLAAKYDGLIKVSWVQALIPLVPFFIFLAAAFILILIYTILLHLYYQPTFKAKKIQLLFVIANLGCFSSLLSIPLGYAFFNIDITVLCIITMAFSSTNSIHLWMYSQQMALHFCTHKLEVLQSEKTIRIDLIPIIKAHKQKPLYRFSQNWFGYDTKDASTVHAKYPQCIVCTERESDVVWLPCGHMSVCTPCCKDIIENKMISCMLCKQKPSSICRVKGKDESQIKMDREMGLGGKKEGETVIEQYCVRIS